MTRSTSQFHDLVAQRYDSLVAYATMLTGSRFDAEDVVHEALIATFSKSRDFRDQAAVESYVRRAIMTRFLDSRRRRGREMRALDRVRRAAQTAVPGVDTSVVAVTVLAGALQSLSPRERACVVMRFVERLSVKETADELALAEGSVKRYVSDGIGKLNASLRMDEPNVDPESTRVISGGGAR